MSEIESILTELVETIPKERVAQIYVDKTLSDTLEGVEPDGNPFLDYEESTVKRKGSDEVNFRDIDFDLEKLAFTVDEDIELFFPSKSDIFDMHQQGSARGGKRRKIFPEEEDLGSPRMESSYEQVEQILEEHFNA